MVALLVALTFLGLITVDYIAYRVKRSTTHERRKDDVGVRFDRYLGPCMADGGDPIKK